MEDRDFSYVDDSDPPLKRWATRCIEVATGRNHLKRLYFQYQNTQWDGAGFFWTAIKALSLDLRYDAAQLDLLPKTGPLVVVANHPFGVLDGIVMCALMQRVRADFRVMTNAVLQRSPEMRDYVLPIDFTETPNAKRANVESRTKALEHLCAGGCLVIFPAGAISTSPDRLGREAAVDWPWTPFLARLVMSAKAPVTPIFFAGQNSRLFQIGSHISMTFRLALFFHEVRRRIGTVFPVVIGDTIPFDEIAHLTDRRELVQLLRDRTYALASRVQTL